MRTTLLLFSFLIASLCQAQEALTINEFMASSDSLSGIADPSGSFADWIELYNKSNATLDLEGYTLSDSYDVPDKFVFPEGAELEANGYVIIWADKDTLEEGWHADFKLSADGEQLILSDPQGMVIDSFSFPMQETNVSYARIPNGTGDFTYRAPTFAGDNDANAIQEPKPEELISAIFPNPVQEKMTILLPKWKEFDIESEIYLKISDINGNFAIVPIRSIETNNDKISIQVDTHYFSSGFYIAEIRASERTFIQKFLIQK